MEHYRLSPARIRRFRKLVYSYYRSHPRNLPWRKTRDPYKILVSEFMLQQTQVDRVLKKYGCFLSRFPTLSSLAHASFAEVLSAWQGLGYNRRALSLHRCAREIRSRFGGTVPADHADLDSLPGIGPATASAIMAFAFNIWSPFIETNIRTVYIHHFFPYAGEVEDKTLLPLVEQTVDRHNAREWFWALMDYGVYLKKIQPNPARRSAHHSPQGRFEGSDRQIRGEIIRRLVKEKRLSTDGLWPKLQVTPERGKKIVRRMIKDGLVRLRSGYLRIY